MRKSERRSIDRAVVWALSVMLGALVAVTGIKVLHILGFVWEHIVPFFGGAK